MITISEKENCCGCGGCAQVCSRQCIAMAADAEGFLYPQVRQESCIGCGACDRVCPMQDDNHADTDTIETYAAYARDGRIRAASSSGGIFPVLARWILDHGGVVFGAAFDEDFSVHHIMAENPQELEKLRGSKYLQSRTENTYREAKNALESGKTVLFTGVACQIAGLRRFLKKDYDRLYTADVLCHGVPSPKIWQTYRNAQEAANHSPLQRVCFRSKATGWNRFSMEMAFENGQTYCKPFPEDTFLSFFLENICLRPSCHRCRFKAIPHASDLTLGDAWGIASHMPDMDDDRGTSLILVNSGKGRYLFSQIRQDLIYRQGQTDVLLPPESDSRKSVQAHPRRANFFFSAENGASVEQLLGVLHGSFLQRALSFGKRCAKTCLRSLLPKHDASDR